MKKQVEIGEINTNIGSRIYLIILFPKGLGNKNGKEKDEYPPNSRKLLTG
ncbi:MAG: hypothetical protein K8S23_05490 [Candidatus Cloacimonetes bacterium]|nr:hypothetical protein [Candidatus Cloacimonadota bacterium]